MGNKRKRTEDEIRKKIEKLEKKLSKRARLQIQLSSEDEIDDNAGTNQNTCDVEVYATPDESLRETPFHPRSLRDESPHPESLRPESPACSESLDPAVPPRTSPIPASVLVAQDTTDAQDKLSESACNIEPELEDDILQLLGDAPKTESVLGPPIHKDVANRWQEILAKGLLKETREQIMKHYSVPNNCDLLLAPTLNPEVKAAIREVMVKRDSALMHQQKQLGVALSALGEAINSIITNETSKQKVLKPISDACRILCDLHFHETKTRRHFVITSINTELKDSLVNTVRDNQLFGDNVTDKIKAAKSIQKSGEALKTAPKPSFNKNSFTNRPNTSKANLNFKMQQRKNDNRTNNVAARGRPSYRTPRAGPSDTYRQPRRSPPPPPAAPRRTHRT